MNDRRPETFSCPLLPFQLGMLDTRPINLLNESRRSIRADLREAAQVGDIEAQRDDGISATALRLGYDTGYRIVTAVVELQETVSTGLELGAPLGAGR